METDAAADYPIHNSLDGSYRYQSGEEEAKCRFQSGSYRFPQTDRDQWTNIKSPAYWHITAACDSSRPQNNPPINEEDVATADASCHKGEFAHNPRNGQKLISAEEVKNTRLSTVLTSRSGHLLVDRSFHQKPMNDDDGDQWCLGSRSFC